MKEETFPTLLNDFRANPSFIIPHLTERISRYQTSSQQTYLLSPQFNKKCIKIHNPSYQHNINSLINTLQTYEDYLSNLTQVQEYNTAAEQILNHIQKQEETIIQFPHNFINDLRNKIYSNSKQNINRIYCLICIAFNSEMQTLLSLLVDDDVKERTNRAILMHPFMKYFGYCSKTMKNKQYLLQTVILISQSKVTDDETYKQQ